MPLPDTIRKRIEAEAVKRGVDPSQAVAKAETLSTDEPKTSDPEGGGSRPVADRLLIGFLPFIKVRELRELWLGLSERIPDDEMTCGDYQLKHGAGTVPQAVDE